MVTTCYHPFTSIYHPFMIWRILYWSLFTCTSLSCLKLAHLGTEHIEISCRGYPQIIHCCWDFCGLSYIDHPAIGDVPFMENNHIFHSCHELIWRVGWSRCFQTRPVKVKGRRWLRQGLNPGWNRAELVIMSWPERYPRLFCKCGFNRISWYISHPPRP